MANRNGGLTIPVVIAGTAAVSVVLLSLVIAGSAGWAMFWRSRSRKVSAAGMRAPEHKKAPELAPRLNWNINEDPRA